MERTIIKKEAKDLLKGSVFILFFVLVLMAMLSSLTSGLLSPVLAFGFYLIVIDLKAGKKLDFNNYGVPFKDLNQVIKMIAASLLIGLIVLLGLILFIVPGVIFALMYSQTMFVMMDDPAIGIREAMDKSKELMKGYKAHLLGFILSFIGHFLLVILTLGLWLIYLLPYFNVARHNYYLHRKMASNAPFSEEEGLEGEGDI